MMIARTRAFLASAATAALLGLAACGPTIQASDPYPQTTLIAAPAKQSLEARLNAFDRELNRGNMGALFDYLPPAIIQLMADESGFSPEFIRSIAGSMLDGLLGDIGLAGNHDLGKAVVGTTGTGTPFAIIPSAMRVSLGGIGETVQGLTLALMDDGQWYFADLADQENVDEIRQAYPEFRSVVLPIR